MNYLRKMKKNAKALSPVVASIILIAVTVAVSIAVAAWMGQMTTGFMQTEQLTVKTPVFASASPFYTVSAANTGTAAVVVSSVTINGVAIPSANIAFNGTSVAPYTIKPNDAATITVTATSPAVVAGNNYQVVLITSKNTQFPVTAIAPTQ